MAKDTTKIPEGARSVPSSEIRKELGDILLRVAFEDEQIVVTRNGRPMAALISIDAYRLLCSVVAALEDEIDTDAVADAERIGDYQPWEKMLKRLREDGS